MTENFVEIYFSLGTNLGEKMNNIKSALERLDKALNTHYDKLSTIIETEPWGFISDSNFLNCVVKYKLPITDDNEKECLSILAKCKEIEEAMGRREVIEYTKTGKRIYHSRIIDIDILLYGDILINHDKLKIPHPLVQDRDFVLIPLTEIVSEKLKPVFPHIFKQNH